MDLIYKKIRNNAIVVYLGGGLLFMLLGFIVIYYENSNVFKYYFAKTKDLFEVSSSEYTDNKWFTCDNNLLYGAFCSDKYGKYYITSTNDGEYFGFYVYNSDTKLADTISEDTFALIDGKTDKQSSNFLSGKGYFHSMDTTEKKYFDDYFEYGDNNASDYKLIYSVFYLTPKNKLLFGSHEENRITSLLLGLFFFIFGLVMFICFISGRYKKEFHKIMDSYGILEEDLNRDMAYASQLYNKVFFGQNHLVVSTINGLAIPYKQMIWAYFKVTNTKHTIYGVIPAGTSKSYQIIIYDRLGNQRPFNVNDENEARTILDKLQSYAPYVIIGFSDELAKLANNGQFNQMIHAVDEKMQKQQEENLSYEGNI